MQAAADFTAVYAAALQEHSRGNVERAVALYQEALAIAPGHSEANANLGAALLGLQRPLEAIACYRAALEADPFLEGAHGPLGMALSVVGQHEEACTHLELALAADPDDADVNYFFGESLLGLGRWTEAAERCQAAFAANPEHADAARAAGVALREAGQLSAALDWLRRARALQPQDMETLVQLGRTLLEAECYEEAIPIYRELAAQTDQPGVANNLALALEKTGDVIGAISVLHEALRRHPDHANAWNTIGSLITNLDRERHARKAFERAIELAPNDPEGWINLADLHMRRADAASALACARQAMAVCPPHPPRLLALANQFELLHVLDAAMLLYHRVLEIDPGNRKAASRILHLTLANCDWSDYDGLVARTLQRVRDDMAAGRQLSYVIFNLLALPVTHEFVDQVARHQSARLAAEVKAQAPGAPPFAHPIRRRERIRIGYLLPYTFFHSMPLVLKEIVKRHDRERFEIYGYSITRSDGTPFCAEFRAAFDRFADVAGANAHGAARVIHEDEIDILVDTTGQTPITCLPIMSLRPAPIQVHAIGFGLSTGADYIDYLVSDRTFMPPEAQRWCTEKLVYMPDCFLPAFVGEAEPGEDQRRDHGLPENDVVFMNFNEAVKFDPRMFSAWMRILQAVPDSVLWLGTWHGPVRNNLRREAEARGVSGDRLVFAKIVPHAKHARRIRLADLALDNLHHGGGVTSIDALAAGVPLLTLRGATPQSRLGATLSQAAGFPDLIVDSLEAYERTAIALAHDPDRRAALRAKLIEGRSRAPLFDVDRYRRNLEQAYEIMWCRRLDGLEPASFDVPCPARPHAFIAD